MAEQCNVDDILCQIEVLRNMRGLKVAIGSESFTRDFPELEGLEGKLTEKIKATEGDIRTALAKCGDIALEGIIHEENVEEISQSVTGSQFAQEE